MQSPNVTPAGAQCAIHPERVAAATCTRCGNFMCTECQTSGAQGLCPTCSGLMSGSALPFSRDDYDLGRLWDFVFPLWKQNVVLLSVAGLIVMGAQAIGQIISTIAQQIGTVIGAGNTTLMLTFIGVGTLLSIVVSTVISGLLTMGMYRLLFDTLEGKPVDLARLFTQRAKLGRYVLHILLVSSVIGVVLLVTFVPFGIALYQAFKAGSASSNFDSLMKHLLGNPLLLVSIPLAIVGYFAVFFMTAQFMFGVMELVYADCGPVEALSRAWQLGEGNRLAVVGYVFLMGFIILVGFFACCVGFIPAYPLAMMLVAALYLTLRRGSGLPAARS